MESAGDMKAFYGGSDVVDEARPVIRFPEADSQSFIDVHARVAVYDGLSAAPYVEDIGPAAADRLIETLAVRVYELALQRGGSIPYTVIREVSENLIHAGFAEPVVSILDAGSTIRFTDQGPGIPDKLRALQPGFTTAQSYMKKIIRGVGSGLPIVSDFLRVTGGSLSLEDNLDRGTVVTISAVSGSTSTPSLTIPAVECVADGAPVTPTPTGPPSRLGPSEEAGFASAFGSAVSGVGLFAQESAMESLTPVRLTTRQKQVMALVLESGSAGPSVVSRELGVGLSTAYRDLASLEDLGLIISDGGKRRLTDEGLSLLSGLSSTTSLSSL